MIRKMTSEKPLIRLEAVSADNFEKVIALSVHSWQRRFVATPQKSLAECYLYRDEPVFPFALLAETTVVGFALLDCEPAIRKATIWRFLIDRKHQRQGYGRAALLALLEWLASTRDYDVVDIDYVDGNNQAKHLYQSLGFTDAGLNEHNEHVMVLKL